MNEKYNIYTIFGRVDEASHVIDSYGLSWQCKECAWWWDGKTGKVAHIRKHFKGKSFKGILTQYFNKFRDGKHAY